jgi:hypothetical protein
MLLRAGALPGHLTLVEQQVIQPAAKPLGGDRPAPGLAAPVRSRRPSPSPAPPNQGRAKAIRATKGQLPKRPIRLKFASCGMTAEGFIQAVGIRFRLYVSSIPTRTEGLTRG